MVNHPVRGRNSDSCRRLPLALIGKSGLVEIEEDRGIVLNGLDRGDHGIQLFRSQSRFRNPRAINVANPSSEPGAESPNVQMSRARRCQIPRFRHKSDFDTIEVKMDTVVRSRIDSGDMMPFAVKGKGNPAENMDHRKHGKAKLASRAEAQAIAAADHAFDGRSARNTVTNEG